MLKIRTTKHLFGAFYTVAELIFRQVIHNGDFIKARIDTTSEICKWISSRKFYTSSYKNSKFKLFVIQSSWKLNFPKTKPSENVYLGEIQVENFAFLFYLIYFAFVQMTP